MYKVILAPTEGSDSEKAALSVAVNLAQRFDAEVRLVRVEATPVMIEPVLSHPAQPISEQASVDERLARLRELEALGTEWRALGNIRVFTAVEKGPVGRTLRDYAKKFNVDLIVMSSHSRGGLRRITLGSVTDYLIRRTNIPVLVVKPPISSMGATQAETFSRIVVPLDGSGIAAKILPHVVKLASGLSSTVNLVQVLTPQTYSQEQIMQPGLPWWDNDIAAAKAYLGQTASGLTADGLRVSTEVLLSDDIASAILDYAMRVKADMIAIATCGNGGMRRFVLGSVADEVARRSRISLLGYHPEFGAAADDAVRLSSASVSQAGA